MKVICAFSSDSRPLYKADIYRALAMPTGHILHFRYKKKYVDDNLLVPTANIKDRKVAIFFTHGNDLNSPGSLTNISVRWAKLVNHETSSETGIYHAYLQLEDFCNVTIDSSNPSEKIPGSKFFSELDCTEISESNQWHDRTNTLLSHFPDITYFHIKGIYKEDIRQEIKYSNSKKSCHYDLVQGGNYILKLSLGNPNSKGGPIILDTSNEITLNFGGSLETSAQFDDFDIPMQVKTLSDVKQSTLLCFSPTGKDVGEYVSTLGLDLRLGIGKLCRFGFYSTVIYWAILFAAPKPPNYIWPDLCLMAIVSGLFWLSSGSLFYWFNKK